MSTHPCKTIKFPHIITVFYFNRLNIPSQLSRLIPRVIKYKHGQQNSTSRILTDLHSQIQI
jgi:hypothetical protein